MSAAHTPGPWAVHPFGAYVVPLEHITRPIGGAEDDAYDLEHYAQEICAMLNPDRHRGEAVTYANARLISAAPELLEALETVLRLAKVGPRDDYLADAMEAGRSAIFKARGQ